MQNKTSSFMKGMGAGMIAGAAAMITGKVMLNKNSKKTEKGGAKLIKAASDFVDGVQTMFR